MIFKGRRRRKQSSENQDFLTCPETILAMSYSPCCFSIPPSTPQGGIPTPHNETPREAGRHAGCSAWRDLRPFSSPPSQAGLGQMQHLAREELPANFSLQLSTQAAAAQPLWKAGQHRGESWETLPSNCPHGHTLPAKYTPVVSSGEQPWLGLKQIPPSSPRDRARTNCSSQKDLLLDLGSACRTHFLPRGII